MVKQIVDEGGLNSSAGRNFAGDLLPPRSTPPFEVGVNIATTSGYRCCTEVLELIRYTAQTEQVYPTPVLFAPPTINRYYVLDLAPAAA